MSKTYYEVAKLIAGNDVPEEEMENKLLIEEIGVDNSDNNDIEIEVLDKQVLSDDDMKMFYEKIDSVISKCPSYFKISKDYEYELHDFKFYNNFLEYVFDEDIKTLEINNLNPQCEVQDLFIGFRKPENYKGNIKMMVHDGVEYIGVGILYILEENNKVFLKSYSTFSKIYFC